MKHQDLHRTADRTDHLAERAVWLVLLAALLALLFWAPAAAAQGDDEAKYDAEAAPSVVDPGKAVLGKHLFRSFCASCHGAEAKGDGSIAEMLRVPPTDLTKLAAENGGEFPFQRSVAVIDGRVPVPGHGTADMPAWGDAFAEISENDEQIEQKIQQLVHYIWSVQETADDGE